MIQRLFMMKIDADMEAKSNDEETKTVLKNFNEKNITCKIQNIYILLAFFINYYCINDSC